MPNQLEPPSPWLVGLLPWVIDLLFKTSFLNSLWGALLWGLLLVVYFTQGRLKDPRLKKNLNTVLLLIALLWTLGWLRALFYPIENPLKPAASLFFLHGSFLIAAAGMLFLVLAGSIAGIYFEKKAFSPRPQKQPDQINKKPPSLEGIINLCSGSLSLARRFWLLGTLLAILAIAVQIAHNHDSWILVFSRWLGDPAVWCVLALAAILTTSKFYLQNNIKLRLLFRAYFLLAFLSLITVSAVIWVESSQAQQGHIQKEFLR